MTEILPTVRIKHPDGFAIINARDFDPETNELFVDPAVDVDDDGQEGDADSEKPMTVEKGPKGLFFVMQDGKRVSKGFASAEDAEASLKPAA